MIKSKRIFCAMMAAILALGACGCDKKNETETSQNTDIPKQLTIFAPLNPWTSKIGKSNNDVLSFQLLEEKTGCHVEWIHPMVGDDSAFNEKFNLMIASRELPDVILAGWSNIQGGIQMYVDDEVIIPLTEKLEKNMPNLTKINKERPEIKKQYTNDNGEIMSIPVMRKDVALKVFMGPQIRKDWLDKLSLEKPTTTDELYNVLKAFKERDPNGNGQADEIPMSGMKFTSNGLGIGQLLWPFETHYDFYVDNGKVKYGIMENNFETGMRYVRKLFEEGLIDPDYILLDRNKMDSKVMNDKVGYVYSYQPTKFANLMAEKNPNFNVEAVNHLKGPGGANKCYHSDYKNDITPLSAAISTANKNPEGTLKWLDYVFGEEGSMIMNFGKEGVTYNMVDGYPKMTDLVLNNPDGLDSGSSFAKYVASYATSFPVYQDWRSYEQSLSPVGKKAIETWAADVDTSGTLPNLFFTAEEQQTMAQVMTQINTYVEENIDKMVLGKESIDNMPQIRERISSMGIQEILDIYQAAFDRYNKR